MKAGQIAAALDFDVSLFGAVERLRERRQAVDACCCLCVERETVVSPIAAAANSTYLNLSQHYLNLFTLATICAPITKKTLQITKITLHLSNIHKALF
jgi:hypothetical protein